MNAAKSNLSEGTSTRTSLAYPGRYPVNDGPKAWIVFGLVLLVVAVAAFALTVRPVSVRSNAPTSLTHPKQGR